MPDNVLDYLTPQRTDTQRVASALHLTSWMALAVWALGVIVIVMRYTPRHSRSPYVGLLDGIAGVGPLVNICGAICGITSVFLRDRWIPGVAFLLNVFAMLNWPSLGYA